MPRRYVRQVVSLMNEAVEFLHRHGRVSRPGDARGFADGERNLDGFRVAGQLGDHREIVAPEQRVDRVNAASRAGDHLDFQQPQPNDAVVEVARLIFF